ncbi:hypothetical protein [Streptomyces sp. NPDC056713]|uniref:hypothetical protein n=1 Tax=Streptomyces sp. NPDC056713 TaxID=3345921 RepID=UPI00368C63A1
MGRRTWVTDGTANVGRPTGSEAFNVICEVATQIPRIGRLQPDLLAAVGPPDLELTDGALRWPVLTLIRKQRSIDEASDGQADVHEDPDHTGPRNVHDGALEDLPEAQASAIPNPLGICHRERIIASTALLASL